MIKISLDEAYIFDILSVYDVKKIKLQSEKLEITRKRFEEISNEICDQIGENKFNEIIYSQEYEDMFNLNLKVFDLVDKCKNDKGIAKEIDDANYERYLKKIELQKKYFDQDLTELKNK